MPSERPAAVNNTTLYSECAEWCYLYSLECSIELRSPNYILQFIVVRPPLQYESKDSAANRRTQAPATTPLYTTAGIHEEDATDLPLPLTSYSSGILQDV